MMTMVMMMKSGMMRSWFIVITLTQLLPVATAGNLRRSLEELSFRLQLKDTDLCVECEFQSSSNGARCEEGDALVLDDCGSGPRQRFIIDGNRISPQGSPELCIMRSENDILLTSCSSSNGRQRFYGLDKDDDFELYTGSGGSNDDKYCFAPNTANPTEDKEIEAPRCEDARDDGTSRWELDDVKQEEEEDDECDMCLEFRQDGRTKTIEPITTRKNIKEFYCYNCNGDFNFNGDDVVPLVPDHSLIFIHQERSSCQKSLVIVHDSKKDSSGGEVEMLISGNLEDSVVQDGRDSPSDSYDYIRSKDATLCDWKWSWQSGRPRFRTDGIAHYWDPNERECLEIEADFIRGIDEWQIVSGPVGSDGEVDPDDYITLRKSKTLKICKCDAN